MSGAFDVLILGSGAAGLTAALNLAPRFRVAVLAKGEGATGWAQGGIAAVLEPGDSFEAHRAQQLPSAPIGLRDAVEPGLDLERLARGDVDHAEPFLL